MMGTYIHGRLGGWDDDGRIEVKLEKLCENLVMEGAQNPDPKRESQSVSQIRRIHLIHHWSISQTSNSCLGRECLSVKLLLLNQWTNVLRVGREKRKTESASLHTIVSSLLFGCFLPSFSLIACSTERRGEVSSRSSISMWATHSSAFIHTFLDHTNLVLFHFLISWCSPSKAKSVREGTIPSLVQLFHTSSSRVWEPSGHSGRALVALKSVNATDYTLANFRRADEAAMGECSTDEESTNGALDLSLPLRKRASPDEDGTGDESQFEKPSYKKSLIRRYCKPIFLTSSSCLFLILRMRIENYVVSRSSSHCIMAVTELSPSFPFHPSIHSFVFDSVVYDCRKGGMGDHSFIHSLSLSLSKLDEVQ